MLERQCSRCSRTLSTAADTSDFTAGYYVAAAWQKFANPSEQYICDACMWADPRYIAVYGQQQT